MISVSANTVQVVVILTGFVDFKASGPSSESGISSANDADPRKRPVPAAHLSFMAKSTTSPESPIRMALGILSPNIEHGTGEETLLQPRAREQLHFGAKGYTVAPIAGGDSEYNIRGMQICVGKHTLKDSLRSRPILVSMSKIALPTTYPAHQE